MSLAVALVLILVSTAPASLNDDPSSRAAGKAGTLALYSWLDKLGLRVHRISGQFDTGASDVVVVADPRTAISDADADTVMRALAGGADLVLAVSASTPATSSALLDRLRIAVDVGRPAGDAVPAQPIDAADRVHHVPMAAGVSIEPAPYLTPLLVQADAITAVAETVQGGGRAYVLASAFPLSNDGLRDADSATLVLSLLERARGGAIAFDEYHHGESQGTPDGAAAVFESPVGLALLLGVAALLSFLAISGRRLGPPLPAGDASLVPSTATYIDAMAGLYARSRDRGGVAMRYADELKRHVAAGVGGHPQDDDAALLAAVARVRPEMTDDIQHVLARARLLATSRPDAAALLALAREVDAVERRWTEPVAPAPAQWRR
jgi:hypothetical protein